MKPTLFKGVNTFKGVEAMTDERNPERPTIEQEGFAAEIRLREAELAFKREEFAAWLEQQKREKRSSVSPLVLAIVAATAGIAGSIVGAMTQLLTEERKFALEMKKFQTSLIFEAVKTGNTESAATNLKFLLDAGFLEDKNGSLRKTIISLSGNPIVQYPRLGWAAEATLGWAAEAEDD